MASTCDTLIIGGDSLIGRYLIETAAAAGQRVLATSRRPGSSMLRLDLRESPRAALANMRAATAVLCAAVTNMQACQNDPDGTRRVNVAGTLAVMRYLADQGTAMVYFSSSQVFDGETPRPAETAPCAPKNVYGRQKREVEETIAAERIPAAVLRVTKVLAREPVGMFAIWHESLSRHLPILAATNLPLAAISANDAATAALRLAAAKATGIWHLSSSDDVPYLQAAQWMAQTCGFPPELVQGEVVSDAKVPAIFRHRHAALSADRIAAQFGVPIRTVRETLAELFAAYPRAPNERPGGSPP